MNPFDQFDQGNPFDKFDQGTQSAPPSMLPDIAKSAATGLAQGTVGLITGPIDLGTMGGAWLANKAGKMIAGDSYIPQEGPPSLGNYVNQKLGIDYEPETNPGKYTSTIASFVPGVAALTEGNGAPLSAIIKKVGKTSVLAGTGSEALGEATEGTAMEPYARVAGAVLGDRIPSVVGGSVAKGASNVKNGLFARSPEVLQDAASSEKSAASPYYKKMRELGDALKPEATNGLLETVDNSLNSLENKYIPELAPQTTAIINAMKKDASGGMLGVSDIDQYMRKLSRVSGINPEDSYSAGLARRAIKDHLDNIGEGDLVNGTKESIDLLNQARTQAAKGFRVQDISDILSKADGDPNKIKSGLTRFLNDQDNTKGWTDAEIAALKNAANTGYGEYLLNGLGRFGFEPKNVFMPLIGGAAATGLFGGPTAAALTIGGTAARQGQKYLARGKAENLMQTLQNRGSQIEQIQPQPTLSRGVPQITIRPKEYYEKMRGK